MTAPTPQEKGQAMTSADEIERPELEALRDDGRLYSVVIETIGDSEGRSHKTLETVQRNVRSDDLSTIMQRVAEEKGATWNERFKRWQISPYLWLNSHPRGPAAYGKQLLDYALAQEARISALEAKLEDAEGLIVRLREALSRERSTVDKDGALKRLVREKDAALDESQTFKGHVRNLVAAYDAKNPMRTADMHDMSCLCLRCVFDHARTALKGANP